uniref:Uncharacterized protein n=1 Tax=Micrurus spixii TaxID=129469 RepID=A0A2D4MNW6_9SAUR
MQPVLNWYEDNYIGHPFRRRQGKQPSLFPIVIWTVFESMQGTEDCANNNWWLCAQLGMCHPTIWKFVNGLREKINFMYSSFLEHGLPLKLKKYDMADERIVSEYGN